MSALLRLLTLVFLPFACGYFLSYLFRTINGVLSPRLIVELHLDASELGLLTAAYFLTAGLGQLPIGVALDRYGPRKVQFVMLMMAAAGAMLFAYANDFVTLFIARALIGLGIAASLVAALKAGILWVPGDRMALFNGMITASGAVGAIAASHPVEYLLALMTWRDLFVWLAAASLTVAVSMWLLVPAEPAVPVNQGGKRQSIKLRQIYADHGFWTLAPLAAVVTGTVWSLHGLWAAPWLRDVARFDQARVVDHLLAMSMAFFIGALGFGSLLDYLRRRGVGPAIVLVLITLALVGCEIAIGLNWQIPIFWLWVAIGGLCAVPVVSFTMVSAMFGNANSGRANGALNFINFLMAFAIQSGIGMVVALWPRDAGGSYPAAAYGTAFLMLAVMKLAALAWFFLPIRPRTPATAAAALRFVPSSATTSRLMTVPHWLWSGVAATIAGIMAVVAAEGMRSGSPAVIPAAIADEPQAVAQHRASGSAPDRPDQQLIVEAMTAAAAEQAQRLQTVLAENATLRVMIAEYTNRVALLELAAVEREAHRTQSAIPNAGPTLGQPAATTPLPAPAAAALVEPRPCVTARANRDAVAMITFARRQTELSPVHRATLDRLAEIGRVCPELRWSIVAPNAGPVDRGAAITSQRIKRTREHLRHRGLDDARVEVVAAGTEPGVSLRSIRIALQPAE